MIVEIIDQISSNSFIIKDDTGKADITFAEDAIKRKDGFEVGLIVKLFGITKANATKFIFNKHSFWLEEKQHTFNTDRKLFKLKDLCRFSPGDIVRDKIIIEVTEIKDTAKTRKMWYKFGTG